MSPRSFDSVRSGQPIPDELEDHADEIELARRLATILQREAWVAYAEAGLLVDDEPLCVCIRVEDAAGAYWLYLDQVLGEVLDGWD